MLLRKTLFVSLYLYSCLLVAQAPSWTVNESLYEFNMTFVAKINIGGQRLSSSSDIVGAFVGGQCRGVANPTFISSSNAYYVYLTVFGNTVGETITFKVYKADTNEEITISTTVDFESNQHIGSRFQSFSIAQPPLRSLAEVTSFGFNDQVADSLSITDEEINFYFYSDIDKTQLTPNFLLSDGAKAFINQVEQTSGVGVRDFSDAVVYQILSEDESVLNEVDINVFDVYDPDSVTDPDTPTDTSAGGGNTGNGGSDSGPLPSFNISQSNENSLVSEEGTQDNFIVFLTQRPQTQAVFTITSSDPGEVVVLNSEITFTPDNINLAQFVYIQGVDDDIQDGNQTSTITVEIDPTRSDAAFASFSPKTFKCITLDNDNTPQIIVVETNGSTQVDESESEDTVFVSLGTEPASNVNLSAEVEDISELRLDQNSLQFTATNWYIPQALVVYGVDDDLIDGSQKSNLILSVRSDTADQEYTALSPVSVEVTTTDNDASSGTDEGDGNGDGETDGGEGETPTDSVDPPVFYKRNAVCYNGGAVKVTYDTSGETVSVNFNGRLVASKSIVNGEVVFSNLERGTYVVEAADVVKVINIDLDE